MAKMKRRLIRRLLAVSCRYLFKVVFPCPPPLTHALLSVFVLNAERYKSLNRTVGVGRARAEEGVQRKTN